MESLQDARNRLSDHDRYDPLLCTIGSEFQEDLDRGQAISEDFRRKLQAQGVRLSHQLSIATEKPGTSWVITDDKKSQVYTIRKKKNELHVYSTIHVVNQIVDEGLCVRCGACEPACPVDILRFNEQGFPYVTNEENCIAACTRCLKVCPGEVVDFSRLDDEMFGKHPHPDSVTGLAKRAYVSCSTDEKIRYDGASGGFVTQLLLYMLDKKIIDGALVLGTSTETGTWQQKPFIARTAEELKRAAKSKYMTVPFLQSLGEMEKIEGNYAVIAVPCYVHAIRKYQKVSKKLRDRIKLVVGLYCNVVFEPHLFDDVCEFSGISKNDVADIHFRHGEWPGGVVAELRDGRKKKVLKLEDMKDEFNLLKLFYSAPRCNMCVDFSAEFADIAVGDPWLRGPDGSYLFEDGRTTVLIRTDVGDNLVRMAAEAGYLNLRDLPLKTYMVNFEKDARYKRDFVPKNILLRKLLRLKIPDYNRPIGNGKPIGFLPMLFKSGIRFMGQYKWFRKWALTLAQTKLAIALFAWNRKRKAKKFTTVYPRFERLAEKFLPSQMASKEPISDSSAGVK